MWRKKQKEKEAFIQKVRHEHIRGKLHSIINQRVLSECKL